MKNIVYISTVMLTLQVPVWGTEPEATPKFDYSSTTAAQTALKNGKFCEAIDIELKTHLAPSTSGYFCKKSNLFTKTNIDDVTELKVQLQKLTIDKCVKNLEKEKEHYQRCVTHFKQIEGCTGANTPKSEDKNKRTGNVTLIYNPDKDCVVTAFPPYTIHMKDDCPTTCAG
jgi:hypothetical protein